MNPPEDAPLTGRRIVLVSYGGPPVVGGVESVVGAQARWLHRFGAEVTVLVGEGASFHPSIAVRQMELLASHPARPAREVSRRARRVRRRVEGLLEEHDTWLLHNVLTMPFNPALTRALFELIETTPAAVISWVHDIAWWDDAYETPDRPPWDLLGRSAAVDCHVAISEHRRRGLRRLYGAGSPPIRVIHDAVEVGDFLSLDPSVEAFYHRHELFEDDLIALYPARLVRRKNVEKALDVTAALRERGRRIHLIITGPLDPHNGDSVRYRDELLQRARALDLGERVIFCCREHDPVSDAPLELSFDRVKQFYRISDVLLMPTRQEGFGLPLVEAGLGGTVICCSRRDPLPEIAGEHAVYFDPDAPAAAIARRIEDRLADQLSVQARRRMRRRFTWPSLMRRKILPLLQEFAPSDRSARPVSSS